LSDFEGMFKNIKESLPFASFLQEPVTFKELLQEPRAAGSKPRASISSVAKTPSRVKNNYLST